MFRALPLLLLVLTSGHSQILREAPGGEPLYRVEIPSDTPASLRTALDRLGYDVSCQALGARCVPGILSQADLFALRASGLAPRIVEVAQPLRAKFGARNGTIPTGYRDLATITAELQMIAAQNPGLTQLVDVAAVHGPGSTFEGRPIWAMKISDNAGQNEDEPEILFVSCHHCREVVTPEIGMELILALISGYGSDPAITAAVDTHEIWIAPVWNPDGLEYTWNVNNLWRKNRKPVASDEYGVDLNRNYPFGWNASCGGSSNPSAATYRGPAPGSEEEMQTMIGFLRARRFAKVVDFHSYSREVRRGYACANLPGPIDQVSLSEAAVLAQASTYQVAPSCCLGGDIHQHMAETTAYNFLIETHEVFQPPYTSAQTEIQDLILPMCFEVLNRTIPVSGMVTSAPSGVPVSAEITVAGAAWQLGEMRTSDPVTGRYHLWLPDGVHAVTFDAVGHQAETRSITVVSGSTATENVALQPDSSFELDFRTTGWGTGDVVLELHGMPAGTVEGFTLFSQTTNQPAGTGILFGLQPDLLTLQSFFSPGGPTNALHWTAPFIPGLYPDGPYVAPPGVFSYLSGTSVDAAALALGPGFFYLGDTGTVRVTF